METIEVTCAWKKARLCMIALCLIATVFLIVTRNKAGLLIVLALLFFYVLSSDVEYMVTMTFSCDKLELGYRDVGCLKYRYIIDTFSAGDSLHVSRNKYMCTLRLRDDTSDVSMHLVYSEDYIRVVKLLAKYYDIIV